MRPSSWALAAERLWPLPACQGPPAAAAAVATGPDPPDVAQATFPVPDDQPPRDSLGVNLEKPTPERDSSWLELPIQDVGCPHGDVQPAWLQTWRN